MSRLGGAGPPRIVQGIAWLQSCCAFRIRMSHPHPRRTEYITIDYVSRGKSCFRHRGCVNGVWAVAQKGQTMTRYRSYRSRLLAEDKPRADRTTVWLLVLVLVATVIALTVGNAEGAALTTMLS